MHNGIAEGRSEEELRNIYEACYRGRFNNPDYALVSDALQRVVQHYYLMIKKVLYDEEIKNFYPILITFEQLVRENNLNNLNENINFLFITNKFSIRFGEELYALMSPHECFIDDEENYFNVINNLFWTYENKFMNYHCNKTTNARIQEILECYMQYYRNQEDPFNNKEINTVANRIGAIFYLKNGNISDLNNVYRKLYSMYRDIKDTYLLNNLDNDDMDFAIYVINYQEDKQKKLIK